MPSITLSSFISGLIHSRAEEERLHASDVEKIAPLGAASDKKAISTGARRAASRRNMDVRPAPGKSDLHLQAHIAGLKNLCVFPRLGVIDNMARLYQGIRKKERCTVCFNSESIKNVEILPCQHIYCDYCFSRLALTAMANEQLFPPRCCSQMIPTEQVLSKLTEKEKALFKLKAREYATSARERRYCPAMKCGKWIPLEKLEGQSTTQLCPYCGTAICPGCKDKAHAPGKCSFDPGLTEFLELARTQGWQRCFHCGAMVELNEGCPRITCRCGADLWFVLTLTSSLAVRDTDAAKLQLWWTMAYLPSQRLRERNRRMPNRRASRRRNGNT